MKADFAGENGADDEFGSVMGIEQTPRLSQIAIDRPRREGQRTSDFLVRIAPPGQNDAIAWTRMEVRWGHSR